MRIVDKRTANLYLRDSSIFHLDAGACRIQSVYREIFRRTVTYNMILTRFHSHVPSAQQDTKMTFTPINFKVNLSSKTNVIGNARSLKLNTSFTKYLYLHVFTRITKKNIAVTENSSH